MATATQNNPHRIDATGLSLTVRGYTIAFDADADPETPFLLTDPDGNAEDYYGDLADAVASAQVYAARREDEARDERLQGLRDAINDALDDCEDEGRLQAILDLLRA
jgi:hypothetical protein